jgi:hypothetical protein
MKSFTRSMQRFVRGIEGHEIRNPLFYRGFKSI